MPAEVVSLGNALFSIYIYFNLSIVDTQCYISFRCVTDLTTIYYSYHKYSYHLSLPL